ncbi:MAG: aldo/keto reductase [Armatimonadetes bacterium]|jgi:D-threo-aldose 1-dehydrogenase|nr:aldo/keto reductase [Armatimonadota bacterium]
MDPLALHQLGRTDLRVTRLGLGTGTLGNLREIVSEAQSDATIETAWDAGLRFYDTAPFYGTTRSEHRLGRVLQTKPRDEYVLTTKIGRVYHRPERPELYEPCGWAGGLPFNCRADYTREGVLRSYEDSMMRLGVPRVDGLLIHDLDFLFHKTEEAVVGYLDQLEHQGGFAALQELRDRGEIRAIGAGINQLGMIPRFLERFDMDFFLVAMPYTLLSQEALEHELPLCEERGCGIVIGAPFASGILARGPVSGATYAYSPAAAEIMEKTRRIRAVCERHDVPMGAAALQFPLAHPAVAAIIPGPNSPEQARQNLEWLQAEIPSGLWAELKAEGLLQADAPTPG